MSKLQALSLRERDRERGGVALLQKANRTVLVYNRKINNSAYSRGSVVM